MNILPIRKYHKNLQKGQALLILLLSMAVILTVVLSSVSSSVSDVTISSYEEDALRAFSAAEAGIERALLTGSNTGGYNVPVDPSEPLVTYSSNITQDTEGADFSYPDKLNAGETATFWLVSHDSNGNLSCDGLPCFQSGSGKKVRFCWGNKVKDGITSAEKKVEPAISVTLYYDTTYAAISATHDLSNVKVKRYAYDRWNGAAHGYNNFTSSGVGTNTSECLIDGIQYGYHASAGIDDNLCSGTGCYLMVKIRMYYNDQPQPLAAYTNTVQSFPAQGKRIEATGYVGESSRKVNVFQTFAEPPSIFDNAIFSLGDFAK